MIRETTGDILTADVAALVNPVNTVGVMGAGLALQFKREYPGNYAAYRVACDQGRVEAGFMFSWAVSDLLNPHRYIINFPTKRHWRDPSRLADIQVGLGDLARVIAVLDIRSIAIPPLGCGLGGLNWVDVRELIVERLGDLTEIDVVLYVPRERDRDGQ